VRDLPSGTVTFLFTDIEGSTRLLNEVGVERYAEIRAEHHRSLREACARHGGVEVDTAGDGLFVAFPTASGAAVAAAEAQRELEGLVAVRMGLHSGEPAVTAEGYAGIDVHRAARIAAAAYGGQILASQTTRDLVADGLPSCLSVRDLGEHRLKDLRATQRLFQLVVEGLPQEFPPPRSLPSAPTNLPLQASLLIGRTQELNELAGLLRQPERRLITLTGTGGSGKTRLALRAASDALDRFPDGVFVVSLEGLDDPALVISAIAQVLHIRSREAASPEKLVAEYVHDKQLLVVLDSFEQVLDAAPLVARLLTGSRELRFLVTSTAPLRVSHETEFPVPPLGVPSLAVGGAADAARSDAVSLFAERARAARPSFELTDENARAVAAICVGVDGLPLAIELAAARARILSPEALLSRLEEPLALLTGGGRDVPDRHRTLRGTIDWSYRLLDAPEQRLFSRLAVFAGGFTLEAVEAVCRPQEELGLGTVDGLAHLVETSMVTSEDSGYGEPRFSMLETLHAYARERLDESGDADAMHRRHAEHFLGDPGLVEIFLDTTSDEDRSVIANIERELENVRAALEWAHQSGSPLELGLAMTYQRSARVFPGEAREKLHRALEAGGGQPSRLRARALAAAGGLARMQGDPDDARICFEESARIYREVDDTFGLCQVLVRLARAAGDRDELEDAVRFAREAEAVSRPAGDLFHLGTALAGLGLFALADGDLREARSLIEESFTVFAELDDVGYHFPGHLLVYLTLAEGRATDAVGQSARFLAQLGPDDPRYGWILIEALAASLAVVGETDVAVRLHAASERWHEERGQRSRREVPPRLRARLFGELDRAVLAPGFETAGQEGRDIEFDAVVGLGVAAAQRVAERA
jgi:predicted ATPase/class 3 adenylate cyclase